MFKHFLIPTDGSHVANKAAKAGIALAQLIRPDPQVVFAYAVSNLENGQLAK